MRKVDFADLCCPINVMYIKVAKAKLDGGRHRLTVTETITRSIT